MLAANIVFTVLFVIVVFMCSYMALTIKGGGGRTGCIKTPCPPLSQHQWVQEFPSQWFYDGKLMPGKLVQDRKVNRNMKDFWPAGLELPLAFCDIVGEEEGQHASGTKRKHIAMESKSNRKEAAKAVGKVGCCEGAFDKSLFTG